MKSKSQIVVALVTAPDLKAARKLSQIILRARLAACANLVPRIESHYWWKGKLERSGEVLMILKTTSNLIPRLEKCVLENHPYDTPEFLVLPIHCGSKKYLDWVKESVQPL